MRFLETNSPKFLGAIYLSKRFCRSYKFHIDTVYGDEETVSQPQREYQVFSRT